MSLNLTGIREIRAPHPGRPKAHNEHCRAMKKATEEQLKRERSMRDGDVLQVR